MQLCTNSRQFIRFVTKRKFVIKVFGKIIPWLKCVGLNFLLWTAIFLIVFLWICHATFLPLQYIGATNPWEVTVGIIGLFVWGLATNTNKSRKKACSRKDEKTEGKEIVTKSLYSPKRTEKKTAKSFIVCALQRAHTRVPIKFVTCHVFFTVYQVRSHQV